ncbi:hypothetical protein BGZ65_006228 [Modicella reniformis]|uniref:Uncharacterized protein n=1 Tax=Modicella reniformis TaxID=1440133 RepID=A0A9P6IWU5_9FUNG|nr:hypothetical protein BGZ65_006228 [Modicella reniformis]
MTTSTWKWKALCDELCKVSQSSAPMEKLNSRIQAIMIQLSRLNDQKPETVVKKIPPLEQQLREQVMSNDNSSSSNNAIVEFTAPLEGLEDGLDADDDDHDDDYDDDYEDDIDVQDDTTKKEPSRSRLKALQAVLRMLLESPTINRKITKDYVKRSGFIGNDFSENECQVVADIANALRPYVPKRRASASGSKTQDPIAHVALRAPLVIIANTILRATGYSEFTRRMTPQSSAASVHALPLGAVGMYETFCSSEPRQFDVHDINGLPLTAYRNITSVPENKRAVFAAFFDLHKIDTICRKHGLKFADRIIYVDRHTIYLTGEIIKHGPERTGYPVVSQFEKRQKLKKEPRKNFWSERFLESGMTKEEMEDEAAEMALSLKTEEAEIQKLRRALARKQVRQTIAARNLKQGFPGANENLQEAREAVRADRKVLIPREEGLRELRQKKHCYNKMIQSAVPEQSSSRQKMIDAKATKLTTPTWTHQAAEDNTQNLDISMLMTTQNANRKVVFAGTDPGVCRMTETVAQTPGRIIEHINRYHVLYDYQDQEQQVDGDEHDDPPVRSEVLRSIKLPTAHRITAGQINEITHTRRMAKDRENQLQLDKNAHVRQALRNISSSESNMQTAQTMKQVDQAMTCRRENRDSLRSFETSKRRTKQLRNQRLRSERAWTKIGTAERRFVQEHESKNVTRKLIDKVPFVHGCWYAKMGLTMMILPK